MNIKALLLFPAALLVALPVQADIYKFVDENGRVTYTNIPKKGAKKLDVGSESSPAKSRSNAGPSSFPRVDSQTQKKRDDMRKQILQDELNTEQKALADAQKALKDGEGTRVGDEAKNYQKYLDRVQRLKDNVASHERNIEALKKELAEFK
jgi:hypothetical protein